MREKLVLNTIVFKEKLEQGVLQEQLLKEVKALGVNHMEVRREFLKDIDIELSAILTTAKEMGISLLYSINEDFVVNGKPNPNLKTFIAEACRLEAKVLKLNTGDAEHVSVEELKALAPLFEAPLQISVENNQTPNHATIANIRTFLDKAADAGLPIRFVFDTGNWYWVGENAPDAFKAFQAETHYLHMKNYERTANGLATTGLFGGALDIVSLATSFGALDYYAFEYPCSYELLAKDIETFEKSLS